MRLNIVPTILEGMNEYNTLKKSIASGEPCMVHGLSESQRALITCGIFKDTGGQVLLLTHNDMEAKKIYNDLRALIDNCYYMPSKEMVFNIDVSSFDIKCERLEVIRRVLEKENIVVVASVETIFYKMPPSELHTKYSFTIEKSREIDILSIMASLLNLGYERVESVEGKGQFAKRGGIIDLYPVNSSFPVRVEFFGDEVDTIRSFDSITQRSIEPIDAITIHPAKEIILTSEDIDRANNIVLNDLEKRTKSLKGKENVNNIKSRIKSNLERLSNLRSFEGMDSYIPYFYDTTESFLDYFDNKVIILDEVTKIIQKIDSVYYEFSESFKSLLEKGEVLPLQGEYIYSKEEILDSIKQSKFVPFNMLPRTIEEFEVVNSVQFNGISLNSVGGIEYILSEIREKLKRSYRIIIFSGSESRGKRLRDALVSEEIKAVYSEFVNSIDEGVVTITSGSLRKGMDFPSGKFLIISDKEVYKDTKPKRKFTKKEGKIQSFTDLKVGDFVVHINHGIGKFEGINELKVEGIKRDFLVLSYKGGDTLYVPVDQLDMVQKYIGSEEKIPKMNKLGGSEWAKTKGKVRESLKEMADELLKLYAERSTVKGYAFSEDTAWQGEFEEDFPYDETPDQLTAIEEIKKDMESDLPMDRLLCGDVGYGKTEVAMRAAFKAVMDQKQVAFLVPTTILAEQHYNNFKERFKDFPVNIDMISRFRTTTQQKETKKNINEGNVDIVIGTHRLLQKDIKYKDLGLLIIDEEQRFGVSHKEKIKALKKNVDVLTLTATPIPRTLHMSFIGARDMSVIETPPEERYPVQTYVLEYNDHIIADAISREISRGGQVYFVYNRVETMQEMYSYLKGILPDAEISMAHGKMSEKELEDVILSFMAGNSDILLCTTIIETGMDIQNANTLIVYDADRMGLSQLYQLRGRVGRSSKLAYAYLTYRKDKVLTEDSEKRLKAIKEFTEFGSGFKIAMRDLEIRGAGNLLGTQQHGHMASVGYDLYCKMLRDEVTNLKGEESREFVETSVEIPVNAYIPDSYIDNEVLKIEIYKKIASISSEEDKMEVQDELIDRFGDIPKSAENLIDIAYLKVIAKSIGVSLIKKVGKEVHINFTQGEYIMPEAIRKLTSEIEVIASYPDIKKPILALKFREVSEKGIIISIREVLQKLYDIYEASKTS
ncbi:transcription-repair coupling factor [Clostridium cylindrosporum]|uniref:Transcription-repair-coupling factor n=1 Tax=Clostridium cylindrosporum DSM 605 TaxID=1121307 RepID=A0A0J8G2X8_CLOCY|nr:transcription-repair coupling factor [Clostridium cylindrosporum]KMT22056.1 transcription-repair-coupling factor Mfd [Clostridium cylindrosporum DSM 605]